MDLPVAVLSTYCQDLSLLWRMADTIKNNIPKTMKMQGNFRETWENVDYSNNRKLESFEITVKAFVSDHLRN